MDVGTSRQQVIMMYMDQHPGGESHIDGLFRDLKITGKGVLQVFRRQNPLINQNLSRFCIGFDTEKFRVTKHFHSPDIQSNIRSHFQDGFWHIVRHVSEYPNPHGQSHAQLIMRRHIPVNIGIAEITPPEFDLVGF